MSMSMADIKVKLEEALEREDWDIVVEIIGDIELEENYTSPYDNGDDEEFLNERNLI